MLNQLIGFWTKSPIALRTNNLIVVWFGIIVGIVVAMAIPTILFLSNSIEDQRYVRFFYAFFTWWPLFSIGGAIFFFHDFWFSLGRRIKQFLVSGQFKWKRPGAVFYGGFLGSLLLVLILGFHYHLSALYALDFIFILIPFFHGASRLACLNFGCCYGKVCSDSHLLKVRYHHPDSEPVRHGIPRGQSLHAVQLYEMIVCMLIGSFMVYLMGRVGEGKIFATYLVCYGAARFVLEFIRDNSHEKVLFHWLSVWQLLSLCFVAAGTILLIVLPDGNRLRMINPTHYIDPVKIVLLALLNAVALGITFSVHFRKRDEPL